MTIEEITLYAAVAYAVGSEVVGLVPQLKSNSIIQLAGALLKRVAGK